MTKYFYVKMYITTHNYSDIMTDLDKKARYYAADRLLDTTDGIFHAQHIKQAYLDGYNAAIKQIMTQFDVEYVEDFSFEQAFEALLMGKTVVTPTPATEFLERQFNEMQRNDKRLIEKIKADQK
jgi:hypothetical protein